MSNLLFFNKEGYPHNFQYESEKWDGKILFAENSNQTFKTQSIHIFEEVDPIDFVINSELLKLQYNNSMGMSFQGENTYKDEIIENIQAVNDSNIYYSKWIYGDMFHRKFPDGSVVKIENLVATGTSQSDFSNKYFTVLNVKQGAILIVTKNNNSLFDLSFETATISSVNKISINDYNRNLDNEDFFNNLYVGKKISIVNSNSNDGIVNVLESGISYTYSNDIKLNGIEDNIFYLKIDLFNERPKIIEDSVILNDNILTFTKNCTILEPETYYSSSGEQEKCKEFQIEDSNGNVLYDGFNFIAEKLIDTKFINTKQLKFKQYFQQTTNDTYSDNSTKQWNTIQFNGVVNLNTGDIISLSGVSNSGTSFLMNNKDIIIGDMMYNVLNNTTVIFTPSFIFDEEGDYYDITQKLKNHQIRSIKTNYNIPSSVYDGITYESSILYSISNSIEFSQLYTNNTDSGLYSNTIDLFVSRYESVLFGYGINVYNVYKGTDNYLAVESLYGSENPYFSVSGYTNNTQIPDDFSSTNNIRYDIIVDEQLVDEYTDRSSDDLYKNIIEAEIYFDLNTNIERYGFNLLLNNSNYYIKYNSSTQQTINDFVTKFDTILQNNGFVATSGYSNDYSGYTLLIDTNVDIWDLDVSVNILSTYTIIKNIRNYSILLTGNEILTTNNLFDIGLSTGMVINVSGSTHIENNKDYNIIGLDENRISLSYQGDFNSENIVLYCKSRKYIRKPRGEYNKDIYYNVRWNIPIDTELDESIFIYDITGDQLIPFNSNDKYEYKGEKPLIDSVENNVVYLNDTPNNNLDYIYNPKYQQTVFTGISFKLEQLDSSDDYNWIPEPLEIFCGYNSELEGVNSRKMIIEKIEKIENSTEYFNYSGYTYSGSSINIPNFIFNDNVLEIKAPVDFSFITYGFSEGQLINFYFEDQKEFDQIIFENIYTYKIKKVSRNKITIDDTYIANNLDIYDSGQTLNTNYFEYFNTTGSTFKFKIEIQPKEILNCTFIGQTEIEDIRFKVNLNNLGIKSEDDIYEIFYESDISDNAVDYTIFNKKRKELLSSFREIYDYIGSYKSLINAINYFGYNDLQLYEYYKNIKKDSYLYEKLHKVLIPDMFDSSVEGWNELDFIAGTYQNQSVWKKTNLFNLAYRITDDDGNNTLIYSLEEVQYKLTKLKNWLRKNIIPISANLLDITGISDTNKTFYQDYDESNQTIKSVVSRSANVVNFNYTATLNFEQNYLVSVNYYILSGETYNENVNFTTKIKTFYLSGDTYSNNTDILVPVQYIKVEKTDLTPFSFDINKDVDPYIYIETTMYDENGLGYVNNKLFYYDEPRNYWLVNNNFDLTKMKYYQTTQYMEDYDN